MRQPLSPFQRPYRPFAAKLLPGLVLLFVWGCGGGHTITTTTVPPPQSNLQPLANQPPNGVGLAFLLTGGSVMFQGQNFFDWYKLTPDQSGSYLKGTWSQIASLPPGYAPEFFASAVLADGRLVIVGGEYNSGTFLLTNQAAIYDPVADSWTSLAPPAGWDYIGDSPSVVLPGGQFLVGRKLDTQMAVLDPTTLQWTAVGSAGKSDFNAEEGWTLLPDGSLLTVDVKNAPNSERYFSSTGTWVSAGSTTVDLHSPSAGCLVYPGGCYPPPGEVGPAVLRPDGTVFATGSKSIAGPGHTAVYTPPTILTDTGTWIAGPDFPNNDNAGDSFAVLLPDGHVLVEGDSGTLYEFDGQNLTAGGHVSSGSSLLVLPTGEVIVGGTTVQIYTSSGQALAAWAPAITSFPVSLARASTYSISGTQFNGLSQAAGYGDENETATNYPLLRITNQATGHVFYARTHGHSTMAVATASAVVSTDFDVPATMETGPSSLQVVANGIASASVSVTVN
ncbi:MAG: Kelch repeat-containing protein [Candidatus Sulfotelmatobacter sp.]